MSTAWNRRFKNKSADYRRDLAWDLNDEPIILTDKYYPVWRRNAPKLNYVYRKDPVPYTGGYSNKPYYRRIHTYTEKRDNEGCIADGYGKLARKKRNKVNLLDSWDDVCYSHGCFSNNWKNQSKKRYQWDR